MEKSLDRDIKNDIEEDDKIDNNSKNDKNHKYELYSREIEFNDPLAIVDRQQSSSDECYEHPYEWYNRDPNLPQTINEHTRNVKKSMLCFVHINRRVLLIVALIGKV